MLSPNARETLIQIARAALAAAVTGRNYAPVPSGLDELAMCCGCFVTYKTGGQLRGCLGCFTSDEPLETTVAHYATLSATQDPRFANNRLRPDELDAVDMDISVLSPLSPCEHPEQIELGTHGIYIKHGWQSGCFLPQVATETGWDVEQFWGYCCSHKAGLPANAWKEPDTECFTFTAEVIEDNVEEK